MYAIYEQREQSKQSNDISIIYYIATHEIHLLTDSHRMWNILEDDDKKKILQDLRWHEFVSSVEYAYFKETSIDDARRRWFAIRIASKEKAS